MKTKIKITIFMCIILMLSAISFAADIKLISPKDGASTNLDNTQYGFTFKYIDSTYKTMSCDLLIDSKVAATNDAVKNNVETTLYSNIQLKEGTHYYEIKCSKDKTKNSSELTIFSYDLTAPKVYSFRLGAPINCFANDSIDNQVSVSVIVTDSTKKLGTCKAMDDAGNYVIVDQDLKIVEQSTIAKVITTPVVEEQVKTEPVKNEVTEVVNEVAKANLTEETNVNTNVDDIPMEVTLNETTVVVTDDKVETKKETVTPKETTPVETKKEETVKTPMNLKPVFIGITLTVLIIAAILAFYMFRKDNEVVIIK